jgi:gliding motility-associated-like protein
LHSDLLKNLSDKINTMTQQTHYQALKTIKQLFTTIAQKSKLTLGILALTLGISPQVSGQYCGVANTDCDFEFITNVSVGAINNTSDCGALYDDFTAQSTDMVAGTTYNGTVTKTSTQAGYQLRIFVDWDNNFDFTDANEEIIGTLVAPGNNSYTYTITPPALTAVGPKRMRVRIIQNDVPLSCDTIARGDVEDYTINVVAAASKANDDCIAAFDFGSPGTACFSFNGSTTSGVSQSLPAAACDGNTSLTANDLWYSFTASGLDNYEITVAANGLFNPVVELFSDCAGSSLGCTDENGASQREVLAAGVLPAGVYYYRVYGNGANGDYSTCVVVKDYCSAANTDCGFEVITNVSLSNLNKCSGCGDPYDNYTSDTVYMVPGQTYNGTATKSDIITTYLLSVFIDWNHDFVFDATEEVKGTLQGTSIYSYAITPPLTALLGATRMRVRMVQTGNPEACGSAGRGDIEDYTLFLDPAGPPAPANDECASAFTIVPTPSCSQDCGTTIGSTESNPVGTSCAPGVANDVWYSFEANGVDPYEIEVTGDATFDPVLELFSACGGTSIDCNDTSAFGQIELISTGVLTAGTYSYRIYGSGGNGNYKTCVRSLVDAPGENCDNAFPLIDVDDYCSGDAQYNNIGVGSSGEFISCNWNGGGNDVWFSFVALGTVLDVQIYGNGIGTNTLEGSQVRVYDDVCALHVNTYGCGLADDDEILNESFGGFVIGTTYMIRIDGEQGNEGFFSLCVNSYTPATEPGHDCVTATRICDINTELYEEDIIGYGDDGTEGASSCLAAGVNGGGQVESSSSWYIWTAETAGNIGMDIIPDATDPDLDVDFVVYQLDPDVGCASKTQLRCNASGGEGCQGTTGMNATSLDVTEIPGCDEQDGYVRWLDMQAGVTYAVLVNIFQNAGKNLTMSFYGDGVATLQGPVPNFTFAKTESCDPDKEVVFTDASVGNDSYEWDFGVDASPATATTAGPHTVSYSTPGIKTAALTVTADGECDTTLTVQFEVEEVLTAIATVDDATCEEANGSVTLSSTGGYGDPANYMYALDGGAFQANPTFDNLLPGDYTGTVKDAIDCTSDILFTVNSTLVPVITPVTNQVACNNYSLPNISGAHLTGNEAFYTLPDAQGIRLDPGSPITVSQTIYMFDSTDVAPTCTGEESYLITINTAPVVINIVETCNMANTEYTVSFEITEGETGTYTVDGVATGSNYTSAPIASGDPYNFTVNDINSCDPVTVSGSRNCNCLTAVGQMTGPAQTICGANPATAVYDNTNEVSDDDNNDVIEYVLHEGAGGILVNVRQTSSTPTFTYALPMAYGTRYYISAIAGDESSGGSVDQSDDCLDVAPGTSVTWIEAPTADFSGDASICEGESTPLTFALTGTGPFNVTYRNGTSNFIVANILDGATVNISPAVTTNYSLIRVSSAGSGCVGDVENTQVTVTVNTSPAVSASTYVCNPTGTGYRVSFDIFGSAGAPYTVRNIAPGGPDITVNGSAFTSDEIPSGTPFEFEVVDANDCEPTVVVGTFTCDCETNAGTMRSQKIEICGNGSANSTHNTATVSLDADDVLEFVLHDGNSNILGDVIARNGIPSFSFNAPMAYGTIYYISAVAGNDDGTGSPDPNDPCFIVAVGTPVEWNQTPTTTASVASDNVCEGDQIDLFSTGNGTERYLWTGPNGFADARQNPFIINSTPVMSGTYTVRISENDCSSTSTVDLNVTPVQNPEISSDPNDPFCLEDDVVTLTAASTGGTWSGTGITDANAGTFDPSVAGAGLHTITYMIPGDCPATDTRDIEVIDTPVPTYTAAPVSGCAPLVVDFENTTPNSTAILWDFGNGVTSNSDITSTIYEAGSYDVTMTATTDGCSGTQTFANAINVDPSPTALFNAESSGAGVFQFENTSIGGVSYFWDFGHQDSTSTEENPEYDYGDQTGSYDVTLTVTNALGCSHTVTIKIKFEEDLIFYVPNSFTPNGDAVNQYFTPIIGSGVDLMSYELKIYNRYGEIIFVSNNSEIGWDGTLNNVIVPNGVYIWSLTFSEKDKDSRLVYEGIVNLF